MWQIQIAELAILYGVPMLQRLFSDGPDPAKTHFRLTTQPTTHEGDAMPLIYGRVRIEAPLLAWYSDVSARNKFYDAGADDGTGTWVPGGPDPVAGSWEYGANLLFVLGLPAGDNSARLFDRLFAVWVGDDKVELDLRHGAYVHVDPTVNPSNPAVDHIHYKNFGVCRGLIHFYAGTDTQRLSDNIVPYTRPFAFAFDDLTEIAGFMRVEVERGSSLVDMTLMPSYRRMATVALTGDHLRRLESDLNIGTDFLDAFMFGQTQDLPPISFEYFSSWHLFSNPQANGDANPVDVIYDILVNPFGRLGLPTSLIDSTSFSTAAGTLANEENGFSHVFNTQMSAIDALGMVVQQAAGALYYDPTDNKIHFKLIRGNYDAATIPRFTADHVMAEGGGYAAPDYRLGGWKNVVDVVEVKYRDRALGYQDSSVVRPNQSLQIVQSESVTDGRLRSATIEYPGCSNRTLATKLGDRDLSLLSQPLASLRITFNRLIDVLGTTNAAQLRPGDVFRLTLNGDGGYNINDVVFRVQKVDPGQLGANGVTIDCAQDPYWSAAQAVADPLPSNGFIPQPDPCAHRRIDEAPRYFQRLAESYGILSDSDKQHVFGLAAVDDASNAVRWLTSPGGGFASDVFEAPPARRFTLTTQLAREAEPYDLTVGTYTLDFGLAGTDFVKSIASAMGGLSFPTYVQNGTCLLLIGDEIIGFEQWADDGSGVAIVGKLWRGLLDTSAVVHPVGAEGWCIGVLFGGQGTFVGRRIWPNLAGVLAQAVPRLGFVLGSGGDPIDTIDVQGRCRMQYPAQNFGVAGESMTGGVGGMPAQVFPLSNYVGYYKSVATLEEEIAWIAYKSRDRYTDVVRRGDESSEDVTDPNVTWSLYAQKSGDAEVALATGITNDGESGYECHALLGKAGHGAIDVVLHTSVTTPAGSHGVPPASTVLSGWDSPRITVNAPRWRNLVCQPRFRTAFAAGFVDAWLTETGSPIAQAGGASSLTRDTLHPLATGANATGSCSFSQVFDVTGYLPRGLKASCWFYYRNLNADADDTIAVDFIALDASNAVLATQSLAAVIGSATVWKKVSLTHATLPANTAKLKVKASLVAVGGGDTRADAAITEVSVYVGDFLDDVFAADQSFDGGALGTWANVVNGFAFPTTLPFASRNGTSLNYAQGGAFAFSEIKRDYTIPVGREFGTFVMRFWRMNAGNNDTGEVTLEALDGGGAQLAVVTTGNEFMSSQNIWYPRRLVLELPDGAVTVRVHLKADRAAGAGNSGACFDEFHGQLHNDLDPSYERILLLSSPSAQPMPPTWQQWHTTFVELIDAGVTAPIIVGPGESASINGFTSAPLRMRWSDDVARPLDTFVGQWGDGVGSISGTRFARQSGAGALDLQSFAEIDGFTACNPHTADSFSVAVWFRVDEVGFATACGIAGRSSGSLGWEINVDATGHLQAVLRGASSAVTATRTGSTVIDGAIHMAVLTHDGSTLKIYDERGSNSVSTAGIGEIYNPSLSSSLRVGRSRSLIDTIPGFVSPVYYFGNDCLLSTQIAGQSYSLWRYGKDPTARITATSSTVPTYVSGPPDANGLTLAVVGADQTAFGYDAGLTAFADADVGDGMGLVLNAASTNLVPSWDFAGASWGVDAGPTLTQSIADATGKYNGVRVTGSTTTLGMKLIGMTLGASATVRLVFFARATTGTPVLAVELQNASNVVKQTVTVALTTSWQRFQIPFSAWDNSTPTGCIRFRSNSGTINFELTSVMWASQAAEFPTMIATAALGSTVDVYLDVAETLPKETNAQGEVVVEGLGLRPNPSGGGTLLTIQNLSNNKNARELLDNAGQPSLTHYDATPTNVASNGTAIDWSQKWQLRGRWAYVKTMDNAVNPYAGIVTTGSVSSAVYGRTASFTYDTTADTLIRIGRGPSGISPLNCYVRRAVIRAREDKLP